MAYKVLSPTCPPIAPVFPYFHFRSSAGIGARLCRLAPDIELSMAVLFLNLFCTPSHHTCTSRSLLILRERELVPQSVSLSKVSDRPILLIRFSPIITIIFGILVTIYEAVLWPSTRAMSPKHFRGHFSFSWNLFFSLHVCLLDQSNK